MTDYTIQRLKDVVSEDVKIPDVIGSVGKVKGILENAMGTLLDRAKLYYEQTGLSEIEGKIPEEVVYINNKGFCRYMSSKKDTIEDGFVFEFARPIKFYGNKARYFPELPDITSSYDDLLKIKSIKFVDGFLISRNFHSLDSLAENYVVGNITGDYKGSDQVVEQLTQCLEIVNLGIERDGKRAKQALGALEEAFGDF
jgi:hypothetical protein